MLVLVHLIGRADGGDDECLKLDSIPSEFVCTYILFSLSCSLICFKKNSRKRRTALNQSHSSYRSWKMTSLLNGKLLHHS